MDELIAWAGFAGAWLLVAGPLLQGALELREEDVDREGIAAAQAGIPKPKPPSRWWWLLPPVMYFLTRHRETVYQEAAFAILSPELRGQLVGFRNKATGWFTVAGGALLIAAKETWELTEHQHWPIWLFWALMVLMAIASIVNTAVRMIRSERETHPGGVRRRGAAPDGRSGRAPRG
jgi:hypothetical protein